MTTTPQTTARIDPARGGYFTVVDRRPTLWTDREEFHVKGYDKSGGLLLHTWHTGEHSMLMEVHAWVSRGAYPQGATAAAAAQKVAKWL